MRKIVFFALIYSVIIFTVNAQNTGAYLIPRRIFVGDRAVLVLPLPGKNEKTEDIILTSDNSYLNGINFPLHANIDFHRIILEQRTGGSRLLIEFTPFVTGRLELPAIEIGGERFTGLTVIVDSVIDSRSSLILSGPAASLVMPGTAIMLYGIIAFFIIFIILTIWFFIKGRLFLKKWIEKWNRWKLFISMRFTEKHLYKSVLRGEDKRLILDRLSEKFRIFLSILTETNCRSMTANEFKKLTPKLLMYQDANPLFLHNFFFSCDELRFSGVNISSHDIFNLLDDLRGFLKTLEGGQKEKSRDVKAAA
ncbi:MAG: hypothetical protein LBC76_07105 [Treponema sp.]|jgi:hypothetical protein|nr:hypothetical protein [Treponema sp.]